MNRFVKLLNFELNRFMTIYLVLVALTLIIQVSGIIAEAKKYLAKADEAIYGAGLSQAQFLEAHQPMSFLDFAGSLWFLGPIAICVAALMFYIFLIWYRDWFGKNTFIYRLLMLPTSRINVYLAKAVSIVLMVLGLVSVQLMILPLENRILKWLVPVDFRTDMTIDQIVNWDYLTILIPQTFTEFILYYGAGFMAVSVLFTALLFERSFRWKGIVVGVAYIVASILVMLSPLLIASLRNYLYPLEALGLVVGLGLLVTVVSLWIGHYLLTKKITV